MSFLLVRRRPHAVVVRIVIIFFCSALIIHSCIGLSQISQISSSPWLQSFKLPWGNNATDSCVQMQHDFADTVVVMKTGATEALSKLPVHLSTTLRCIPNYIIVSDFEETIEGTHVYDALEDVDIAIKQSVSEFTFYNKLKVNGRSMLTPELISSWANTENSGVGKDNPAWRLDKWKFLPMLNKTLELRPNAKWYVFLEADSYLVWPNLNKWLQQFNPAAEYYLGYQMQIADTVFAYGGAGYVLSNPALQKVVKYRQSHLKELDEYTSNGWAGDEILGHALSQVDIPLHWSYPNIQSGMLFDMNYGENAYDRKLWCYSAISWHHMSPEAIAEMYKFDQSWDHMSTTLLYSSVFKNYILPQIENNLERDDWDNLSETVSFTADDEPVDNVASCRLVCEQQSDCVQYSYKYKTCRTSNIIKLGGKPQLSESTLYESCSSGWLKERVHQALAEMGRCGEGPWIMP